MTIACLNFVFRCLSPLSSITWLEFFFFFLFFSFLFLFHFPPLIHSSCLLFSCSQAFFLSLSICLIYYLLTNLFLSLFTHSPPFLFPKHVFSIIFSSFCSSLPLVFLLFVYIFFVLLFKPICFHQYKLFSSLLWIPSFWKVSYK